MEQDAPVAVFIDVENVGVWVRNGGLEKLMLLLAREYGTVAFRRAYAD